MTSGNMEEEAEGRLLMKLLWEYYKMRMTYGCDLVMQSCKLAHIVAMENAGLHPGLCFPYRWRIYAISISSGEISCESLFNFGHLCSTEMFYSTLKNKKAQGRGSKVIMRMGTVWREEINQLFVIVYKGALGTWRREGEALFNSKRAW